MWSRVAKQRLIDSMTRQFDIASLYLYVDDDGSFDCIDGRQRIGAIMSFLKLNPDDAEDNGFEFRVLNEIYEDHEHPFATLNGLAFDEVKARSAQGDTVAADFVAAIDNYNITIVQLKGSSRPEEFNLQFTRLNLGTIINSGEMLHAMVGELRDICFREGGLGEHQFFQKTRIPTRRYATEQVAAQLLMQIFSLIETEDFTRTRHFDLQRWFKAHTELTEEQRGIVEKVRTLLDLLDAAFDEVGQLRSRAITVSTVLLAWQLGVDTDATAQDLARFINGFVCRLQWQVKKGLDVDDEYRHLIDFQRNLTQASVEKPAVRARAELLRAEFEHWQSDDNYRGDQEYQNNGKGDPDVDCLGQP